MSSDKMLIIWKGRGGQCAIEYWLVAKSGIFLSICENAHGKIFMI